MKTSRFWKILEQLAALRYYSHIANCQTKFLPYFKGHLEFFAVFQSFINVFHDFLCNPYDVWQNPRLQENLG